MERLELDAKQHYVIWKVSRDAAKENEIGWKMLENNQITGLLPFDYYYIDDFICFRYSYYSLQRIEEYFQKKKGGYDSLYLLCEGVLSIVERGAEYLLNACGYLILPEWIFWNYYEKKVCLCYLPGRKSDLRKGYTTLVEYLMEHTDHADKKAVEFIYGLYDFITSESFVVEDVRDFIRKRSYISQPNPDRQDDDLRPDTSQTIVNHQLHTSQSSADAQPDTSQTAVNRQLHTSQMNTVPQGYLLKRILSGKKAEIPDMLLTMLKSDSYMVSRGESMVGRMEGNDLYLPADSISRKQALLAYEDGMLYVMDTGSKNGTYVNGNKISAYVKTKCKEGDVITFADISYQVQKKI